MTQQRPQQDINREEFLARLDQLIKFATDNRFRGSTQGLRALKRLRNLAVFRSPSEVARRERETWDRKYMR
jgi:hypothetical protein